MTNLDGKKFSVNTKHGMWQTRQYRIWVNMRTRCTNPKANNYHNYGGRGITYDPKWETFEGFWEDMQEGYSDELTLDRIDNDGNYCKENCKWITMKEQQNNRRNNHLLTHDGKTQTIAEWARELNVSPRTLVPRITTKGWSVEKGLTTPVKKYNYGRKTNTQNL